MRALDGYGIATDSNACTRRLNPAHEPRAIPRTAAQVLRGRPARALVLAAYVGLLAGSSLLSAWGNAGQYAMLSELGGPDGRLAINSLATAQVSFAVIVGPVVAGPLLGWIGPGWLVALDGASFAFLGIQAWRTPSSATTTEQPVDPQA